MYKFLISTMTVVFLTQSVYAQAVLIEDPSSPSKKPAKAKSIVDEASSWFSSDTNDNTGQSSVKINTIPLKSYENSFDMRADRRVGAGLAVSGAAAVYGLAIDLNFSDDVSALLEYGSGAGFNSFTLSHKKMWTGNALAFYTKLGWSHWYSSQAGKTFYKTTPSFLSNHFLSESEMASGKFAEDFFVPAVGMQFHQLRSAYTGFSVYAEIDVLMNFSDPSPIPTGGAGALFYF